MLSQEIFYRLTLSIHGRVQGVWFRESACAEAKQLGLVGTVANNPDGTVQILAEGPKEILEEFKKWCERGPELAAVEGVKEKMEKISGFTFTGFSCIYH